MERRLVTRDVMLTGRVRLRLYCWSSPSAHALQPPIILLHPNRTNARLWDHMVGASRLARAYYAPDQRGHGWSEYPIEGYGLDDYIADDVALLDALELEQAIVVGAATGGNLGLLIASRFPERVTALVVVDPGLSLSRAISVRVQGEIRGRFRFPDYETAKRSMPFSQHWSKRVREHYARESFRILPTGEAQWHYYADGVAETEAALEQDVWDQIHVSCPTLIVRGDESDIFPPEHMERLHSLIPHARTATITNAYHRLMQDTPVELASLIDTFIEGLNL